MKRRASLQLGLALAVVAVSAACGGSGDDDGSNRAAPAGSRPGGTLRVAIGQPGSVDPGNVYEPNGELIVRTMCDPLIQLDPATGALRPSLAESWQVSDRGTKFVIRLRKGLRFNNGARLTSDDVVFSLTRVASAEFASQAADTLSLIKGYDEVHGIETTSNVERRNRLEGVRVIDSRSFEVKLRKETNGRVDLSMADYLRILTLPLTSPVPRALAQDDPDKFSAAPVCAGPYRLAGPWTPKQSTIKLVRATGTKPRNNGFTRGGAGYADVVEFHVVDGLKAQRDAFAAGTVHVAAVGAEALPDLRTTQAGRLAEGHAPGIDYVGVSTNPQAPWGRPAVRVALSQALDRSAIVTSVANGSRRPATGFLPPSLGRQFSRKSACAATMPEGGDVAAAKDTLTKAGLSLNGVVLPFAFNDEFGNAAYVQAIADQWREAFGLDVQLQPMAWADYQRTATSSAGFPGAFRLSWQPQYPGPDQYIGPLFTSRATSQGNFSHFSDVRFDTRLTRETRRANEPADLALEYRRLETQLCATMPLIPVTFAARSYLIDTTRLVSAQPRPLELTTGLPALRELSLKDHP